MDQTKRRVPIISFLLSFVLPGLGHVYNGRLGEGILFFFGAWLVAVLIVLGLSGLISGLWSLVCILFAIPIVCQILIATHAAIEAARLKVVPLKWYNSWYFYISAILIVSLLENAALDAAAPFARRHLAGVAGVRSFRIASSPMKPTLEEGDHVTAKSEKYEDRLPRRGDIIFFPYPEERSKRFVMRVIGLPGERIEIKDKIVFINNQRLVDLWGIYENNVILPRDIGPRDNFGPVQIPEGAVFVLGDNRDFSHDSRFWGNVQIKEIEGKAMFIYWSNDWDRIGIRLH